MIRYCVAPRSVLALSLLAACAPRAYEPANALHVNFALVVDTSFTDHETEEIARAADEWESATDGLSITVYSAPCDQFLPEHAICVEPKLAIDMPCVCRDSMCDGCWTDGRIELDRSVMQLPELRQIAVHEIGHSIGLPHNHAHTAMAYRLDIMTPPTCEDIENFWKQYGVRGRCKV